MSVMSHSGTPTNPRLLEEAVAEAEARITGTSTSSINVGGNQQLGAAHSPAQHLGGTTHLGQARTRTQTQAETLLALMGQSAGGIDPAIAAMMGPGILPGNVNRTTNSSGSGMGLPSGISPAVLLAAATGQNVSELCSLVQMQGQSSLSHHGGLSAASLVAATMANAGGTASLPAQPAGPQKSKIAALIESDPRTGVLFPTKLLTKEEKKLKRIMTNRLSAQNSRQRYKAEMQRLRAEGDRLKLANKGLRSENSALSEEVKELLRMKAERDSGLGSSKDGTAADITDGSGGMDKVKKLDENTNEKMKETDLSGDNAAAAAAVKRVDSESHDEKPVEKPAQHQDKDLGSHVDADDGDRLVQCDDPEEEEDDDEDRKPAAVIVPDSTASSGQRKRKHDEVLDEEGSEKTRMERKKVGTLSASPSSSRLTDRKTAAATTLLSLVTPSQDQQEQEQQEEEQQEQQPDGVPSGGVSTVTGSRRQLRVQAARDQVRDPPRGPDESPSGLVRRVAQEQELSMLDSLIASKLQGEQSLRNPAGSQTSSNDRVVLEALLAQVQAQKQQQRRRRQQQHRQQQLQQQLQQIELRKQHLQKQQQIVASRTAQTFAIMNGMRPPPLPPPPASAASVGPPSLSAILSGGSGGVNVSSGTSRNQLETLRLLNGLGLSPASFGGPAAALSTFPARGPAGSSVSSQHNDVEAALLQQLIDGGRQNMGQLSRSAQVSVARGSPASSQEGLLLAMEALAAGGHNPMSLFSRDQSQSGSSFGGLL